MGNIEQLYRVSREIVRHQSAEEVLHVARRLNSSFLLKLLEIYQNEKRATNYCLPEVSSGLLNVGGERAILRAAQCPILLLDFHFTDLYWWLGAGESEGIDRTCGRNSPFQSQVAASLIREALLEIRGWVRAAPMAVSLNFGLVPAVRAVIAEMTIPEVDLVSESYWAELRPRWSQCAPFWSQLVRAAVGSDDKELDQAYLHAIQLLGADLIRSALEEHREGQVVRVCQTIFKS